MILPKLISALIMLAQPAGSSQPGTESNGNADIISGSMSSEIAISRIAQAVQVEQSTDEQQQILNEVYERCEDPQLRAIAAFDIGTLLFQSQDANSGVLHDAIEWFQRADLVSDESSIQNNARYQIGLAHYLLAKTSPTNQAATSPSVDPQGMLEQLFHKLTELTSAAGAFRSAAQLQKDDQTSRENLERVRLEIKKTRDQIQKLQDLIEQQRQEAQQRQQQQQDSADELNELAQQQQAQADNSKQSPPQSDSQRQQQRQEQGAINEETGEAQQRVEQQYSNDQSALERIREKLEEARAAQNEAKKAMDEHDQSKVAEQQQKAADALREAAGEMQRLADQSQSEQQGDNPDGDSKDASDENTQSQSDQEQGEQDNPSDEQGDEIDEIAKILLDKERRERESRKAYRATGRPTRVEKDW